ncbi:MAG: lysophospholipid acyltransferase family protein [Pseudomonadota bacterium]
MTRILIKLLVTLILLLIAVIPFCLSYYIFSTKISRKISIATFLIISKFFGLKVKIEGELAKSRPILLVSNHFSYIDVLALLNVSLNLRFTPKKEIASWTIIGSICKMSGCVFIDRNRSKTNDNKIMLDNAFKEDGIIALFPEGTTNEGIEVLPFKSSYFSIAEENDIAVQPLSIIYTKLDGKPITKETLPIVGWYGDMEFFPHLIALLKHKSFEVKLVFHAPVKGSDFNSRKELAKYCHDVIQSSFYHNI